MSPSAISCCHFLVMYVTATMLLGCVCSLSDVTEVELSKWKDFVQELSKCQTFE
jgi:hypothetical protein